MKVLLNYANHKFIQAQKRNSLTGLNMGQLDIVRSFGPDDIDESFRKKNQAILSSGRGGGYWLWKPYIISRALDELSENDCLFYCDSGAHFVGSIDPIIQWMQATDQDLICFATGQTEKARTKRDAFLLTGCDDPTYTDSRQRAAGFSLWRKSNMTISLACKWLNLAQDPRVLTDQPNECGQPNYSQFIEHRHDQSIFSLLTKQLQLPSYRRPSRKGHSMKSPYRKFIQNDRWQA